MIEITKTENYSKWYDKLRDLSAKAIINIRLRRIMLEQFGEVKNLKGGVFEIKINHGPGYRIYYTQKGKEIILLLLGGDKSDQERNIAKAREILNELGE
jgi:putative addiction module killer protein